MSNQSWWCFLIIVMFLFFYRILLKSVLFISSSATFAAGSGVSSTATWSAVTCGATRAGPATSRRSRRRPNLAPGPDSENQIAGKFAVNFSKSSLLWRTRRNFRKQASPNVIHAQSVSRFSIHIWLQYPIISKKKRKRKKSLASCIFLQLKVGKLAMLPPASLWLGMQQYSYKRHEKRERAKKNYFIFRQLCLSCYSSTMYACRHIRLTIPGWWSLVGWGEISADFQTFAREKSENKSLQRILLSSPSLPKSEHVTIYLGNFSRAWYRYGLVKGDSSFKMGSQADSKVTLNIWRIVDSISSHFIGYSFCNDLFQQQQ